MCFKLFKRRRQSPETPIESINPNWRSALAYKEFVEDFHPNKSMDSRIESFALDEYEAYLFCKRLSDSDPQVKDIKNDSR